MFEVNKFTRDSATEQDYHRRAVHILERHGYETGLDWDLHPQALVEWLHGFRDGVSPAYWRRTRAGLSWFFGSTGQQGLSDAIRRISTDGCPPARQTSARKKKSVSDDEIVGLTQYMLSPSSTPKDHEAYYFFLCGLLTGLRPVEWSQSVVTFYGESDDIGITDAYLADPKTVDRIKIVVQNAKATNGRAHGPTRTLEFPSLQLEEKEALLKHCRFVADHLSGGTFPQYQRSCSDKIRYVGKKLWPSKRRRISLYSGRHQSMANGKASGLPRPVIAAMHGHATDRTCQEHYGRKQFGKAGRVYAQVPDEEVARVREVPSTWRAPDRRDGPEAGTPSGITPRSD